MKPNHSQQKVDRSAFSIGKMEDQHDEQLAYWAKKTPVERLSALEFLRQTQYGPTATQRLQRVLVVSHR